VTEQRQFANVRCFLHLSHEGRTVVARLKRDEVLGRQFSRLVSNVNKAV
jgi:hypothetical protein